MKISIQRTLFEIINFLMALLFVIPLGVMVEQLCGMEDFRCCFLPCTAIIGHLMGRFSLTKPMGMAMAMCGIGALLAACLALLLGPGLVLATILCAILALFFSVFFFFSARKALYTVYAPMTVGGVILHLLALLFCAGYQWPHGITTMTTAVSIVYFLLALYSFSATGLRKSLHKTRSAKSVSYPAGMQMGNFFLVTGFILIAVFISNIHPIFTVFSNAFVYVLRALIAVLAFIGKLFTRRTTSVPLTEEAAAETSISEDSILNAEPKGEAAWITSAVEVIAFIVVLLFLSYCAFKVMQKLRASGAHLPAFLRNLRDRFAPVEGEDFIDETENLFDMKKMLSETGGKLKDSLKKLRERPQKLDDFPDPRMKLRFTFQQLLKKVQTRNPSALSKTPNEIYEAEYPGEEDFRAFMDYYNEARYSEKDIPEDAVDCARQILKQKM